MKELNDYTSRYESERIREEHFIDQDNRARNIEYGEFIKISKEKERLERLKRYETVINEIEKKIK